MRMSIGVEMELVQFYFLFGLGVACLVVLAYHLVAKPVTNFLIHKANWKTIMGTVFTVFIVVVIVLVFIVFMVSFGWLMFLLTGVVR